MAYKFGDQREIEIKPRFRESLVDYVDCIICEGKKNSTSRVGVSN